MATLESIVYWMVQYAEKYFVKILAYCLMTNHVHFIVVPSDHNGLAQLFKTVHMRYSHYKNRSKSKVGHLWQGRFYSNILDEVCLLRAMRYVERNPARAGMVKNPWEYIWAGTREHVGLEKDPIIKTHDFHKILRLLEKGSWKNYIEEDDPQMAETFKNKILKCSVIGTEDFISNLEQKTGYCLKDKKLRRPFVKK